jgi:hypothetical protein
MFEFIIIKLGKIFFDTRFGQKEQHKNHNTASDNLNSILIQKYSLSPKINDMFDHLYSCQYTILIINIFNYILLTMIKIVDFENTHRGK